MDISGKNRERGTVISAVLMLVVIGVSLLVSTWQTMRHQREAEEQHLVLTSRAVLLAVESFLRRGPIRLEENNLAPQAVDLFQGLEQDGDVLFAGIIDSDGGRLLSAPLHGHQPVALPAHGVQALFTTGEWHGRIVSTDRKAYVYAKKLSPVRGRHMTLQREATGPPVFLVVGIDMEKHLNAYKGFFQNAIFQTVYILAAALLTWGLAVNFLSRREQATKALSLERFQAKLLDNLPDGLITLDAEHIITGVNPAALAILGRAPETLIGQSLADLPLTIAKCVALQPNDEINVGWRRIRIHNTHLEVLTLPFAGDSENTFLVILRDRTQLRRLEQSLADAEKLAAIGTLAAGVAHEVRNPLSSLRGFAQYFVKKLAGKQPEEEYAKTMVREADRLNRVITDLLFLSKPRTINPQIVDLAGMTQEILSLLRFDLEQKSIQITTHFSVATVYADADAFKQILLNLLLNSLDALPHAGPPLEIYSQPEEGGVWVWVRDHGCGMTPEQLERAFEAFFTAKEHGTGLGLALVQRIMHDHGGSADILSKLGDGCTVRLFFPAREEESEK